jgi:hypothetical protein
MIYHYTNINTLASILDSGKIRFSRLDGVDDLREAQTVAGIQFGKYFFVSCWTKTSKEHIPLWNMYTRGMKGVRIGLPDQPFRMAPLKAPPSWNMIQQGEIISPLSFEEMFCDTYSILPVFLTPHMFAGTVSYVPDISIVYKENVNLEVGPDNQAKLNIGNMPLLPRTKDDYWEFQDEFRFVLLITPSIPVPPTGIGDQEFAKKFANHILSSFVNGIDPGIDYYDIRLDETSLNSIEIILGPRTDHSDHLLVEALVGKYTTAGRVNKSTLAIR